EVFAQPRVKSGRNKLLFRIEIKGVTGSKPCAELTPNEWDAMQQHLSGEDPHYRLAIVSSVLSGPCMHLLMFSGGKWIDECGGASVDLKIKRREAARIEIL